MRLTWSASKQAGVPRRVALGMVTQPMLRDLIGRETNARVLGPSPGT